MNPPPRPLRMLHVDMDAFFAAVEILDNPDLKGKPVIIGSPPNQRGVVSTASYEARKFGVHSAMPSRTAAMKCPDGIFLPVRMARYQEMSRKVMAIFHRYTPDVEPLSIDEAFLDVHGVLWLWKSAEILARHIQSAIQNELGLSASIGVAPNKFLAKLSSDMNKPAGCTVTPTTDADIAAFLAPLPVERIWGVGAKTLAALQAIGIRRIKDLQASDPDLLASAVGERTAAHISRLARGLDDRVLEPRADAKSISGEHTFSTDVRDPAVIRAALIRQVERVGPQLREAQALATTATFKIRFAPFDTLSRQLPLNPPSQRDHDLIAAAGQLLDAVTQNRPVRLIGFGVTGLIPENTPIQADLFGTPGPGKSASGHARLDQAMDAVRERYGKDTIGHASGMMPKPSENKDC